MTPLRQRMIEDLQIRNYSDATVEVYIRSVAQFSKHFGKSPDALGLEDIRKYQVYLIREKKVSYSTLNIIVAALRFLYKTTLNRKWNVRMIPYARKPKKLPKVLSQEEVISVLDALSNIKHLAMVMTMYAVGLRVSEVAALRLEDIDSTRMLIHVHQGKGKKDRLVPLSEKLLQTLREYYSATKPRGWLFPGQNPQEHINRATINLIVKRAGLSAIGKRISPHTFRHSNATHLLEAGVNIRIVQGLLGHKRLSTTDVYSHVTRRRVTATKTPLDMLDSADL